MSIEYTENPEYREIVEKQKSDLEELMTVFCYDDKGIFNKTFDILKRKFTASSDWYTTDVPPLLKEHQSAQYVRGRGWEIITDYRGEIAYDETYNRLIRIGYLGELREGHIFSTPPVLLNFPKVTYVE